jgi:hypothetical protein
VLLLTVPQRYALVLPALVLVYFAVEVRPIESRTSFASRGALFQGIRSVPEDWIDRAVGRHADVAAIWTNMTDPHVIWENEFFNRSVGPVYAYNADRTPDPLPETTLTRRGDDLVAGGKPVHASYVLADSSLDLDGKVVATDPLGPKLYRVKGPLVTPTHISGLYPDTWSHRVVTYRRDGCTGGTLAVSLESDAALFKQTQIVTANAGVKPGLTQTLTVPLTPRDGRCVVTFRVAHLANPSLVEKGSTDDRLVGAHFDSFDYTP